MYAIKMTGKYGTSKLLPAINDKSKVMTFDTIEEAEENLAICKNVAKIDKLTTTFEIVDYNP